MTELLFREDAYLRTAQSVVVSHTPEGGIVVDRSVFYPTGGGQLGDSGTLSWDGQSLEIATALKAPEDQIVLIPAEPVALPPPGATVMQSLDWDRRYKHMRMHTGLHLLSVAIPLPVTGGAVGADKGRLDFLMPEPPDDRDSITETLNAMIDQALEVSERWITEAELDENPELVKTMSVQPPRGAGQIRLVQIGQGDHVVDLQPCGGTHVRNTSEVGRLQIGKIENKGKQNRRVSVSFN